MRFIIPLLFLGALYAQDPASGQRDPAQPMQPLVCSGTNCTMQGSRSLTVGTNVTNGFKDGGVTALNLPTVTINIAVAPYYASGSATTTTTSGAFAAGTSGSVVSCASFSANQGIYIAGAGAGAANYIGTVVSCSGTALTVTPATATSVGNGTLVQHDDSAAFQSAINALGAANGGTLFVPDGFYRLNGPQTNGSILNVPARSGQSGSVPIDIRMLGSTPPEFSYSCCGTSGMAMQSTGAILQTNASSGNLIGGYYTPGVFTVVRLDLTNLTLRAYDNPGASMVNAQYINQLVMTDVQIDTGVVGSASQPTHSNGVGVWMPWTNNGALSVLDRVQVFGYYVGAFWSEHGEIKDTVFNEDYIALRPFDTGHAMYASRVLVQDCPYAIYATDNFTSALSISELDLEQSSGVAWSAVIDDIYDPSSLLKGIVNYRAGSNLTISGANNLILHNLVSSPGNVLNSQGPGNPITGNGANQQLYTYTIPGVAIRQGQGLRMTFGANNGSGAATNYNVYLNSVNVLGGNFQGNTFNASQFLTVMNTGSTTGSYAESDSAGQHAGSLTGLNWAANQTLVVNFAVSSSGSSTPQMFLVEIIQ